LNNELDELTKLEAAQRQLDAAIRLFLSSEDELAIHTLAAAAYRIFRDLKEKRGRTELTDLLSGAAFGAAKQIAEGKLKDVPPGFGEELRPIVLSLVEGFKAGTLQEPDQVHITARFEKRHWTEFNAIANFLKHADKDSDATLKMSAIGNVRLLEDAIRSYVNLAGSITSEMAVFHMWLRPEWPVFAELLGSKGADLNLLDPEIRRGECLVILRELSQR